MLERIGGAPRHLFLSTVRQVLSRAPSTRLSVSPSLVAAWDERSCQRLIRSAKFILVIVADDEEIASIAGANNDGVRRSEGESLGGRNDTLDLLLAVDDDADPDRPQGPEFQLYGRTCLRGGGRLWQRRWVGRFLGARRFDRRWRSRTRRSCAMAWNRQSNNDNRCDCCRRGDPQAPGAPCCDLW